LTLASSPLQRALLLARRLIAGQGHWAKAAIDRPTLGFVRR
jgi:hypothetical protein